MNYNPYPASYMTQYRPQPNNSNMIWVQGESGAKAFPVGPGANQVLFDSEKQVFYIKSVDSTGMPQPLRTFSYSEYNEADTKPEIDTSMFITRDEFNKAINSLKQQKNNNNERKNNNGKSLIPRTND